MQVDVETKGELTHGETVANRYLLLEKIEYDPDINQSTLATQLGVAVGTVNLYLKRFIDKGFVKVMH